MKLVAVARWSIALLCIGLLSLAPREAAADWEHLGNPVCVAPGAQHDPICMLPWVAWTDERDGVPQAYALSLYWFTGATSPANGLHIAPSSSAQSDLAVLAHTWDGSLWAAWAEDRDLGTGTDIFLMRVIGGAPAPGWPVGGLRITSAAGDQRHPRLVGGARFGDVFHAIPFVVVTWEDSRAGAPALYATSVDIGAAASPGWIADGTPVSVGTDPVVSAGLVARGQGTIAVYEQSGNVFAQAVSRDGVVPADPTYPVGGRQLNETGSVTSHASVGNYNSRTLVAWEQEGDGHTLIKAQGLRDSLGFQFWSVPATVLDDPLAQLSEVHAYGDDLVAWRDQRADAGDIYFNQLFLPTGPLPSFPPILTSGQPRVVAPGRQSDFSEPMGGFWEDVRSGVPQIFALDAYALPNGEPMAPTGASQTQPSASVTIGGFIPEDPPLPVVVWTDTRNPATGPDIYAQVLGSGPGSVGVRPPRPPAEIALSNARPTPSRGAVSFTLELPVRAQTGFAITDVSGRVVRSLGRDDSPAGRQTIAWDARTDSGTRATPGIYWLRGTIGSRAIARRIVLLSD